MPPVFIARPRLGASFVVRMDGTLTGSFMDQRRGYCLKSREDETFYTRITSIIIGGLAIDNMPTVTYPERGLLRPATSTSYLEIRYQIRRMSCSPGLLARAPSQRRARSCNADSVFPTSSLGFHLLHQLRQFRQKTVENLSRGPGHRDGDLPRPVRHRHYPGADR